MANNTGDPLTLEDVEHAIKVHISFTRNRQALREQESADL